MIRNIKILGITVVAAMALSAVVASAAMAVPQFTASTYPAQVTGTSAVGAEKFKTDGGTIECKGHFLSASLGAANSTLTVTPKYSECTAFGGLNATFNTEGCTYVFHATELVSAGVYKHHVDIVCPAGQSVKFVASTCKAEIKSQTGLTTVKTTNSGTSVVVNPEVTKIAYTVTEDGFLCPFTGTGSTNNGEYTGAVTVSRVGGGSASVSGS